MRVGDEGIVGGVRVAHGAEVNNSPRPIAEDEGTQQVKYTAHTGTAASARLNWVHRPIWPLAPIFNRRMVRLLTLNLSVPNLTIHNFETPSKFNANTQVM